MKLAILILVFPVLLQGCIVFPTKLAEEKPFADSLFTACFFAALAGLVAAAVGWRQLGRRKVKIGRIIREAEARGRATDATPEPGQQKSFGA